MGQFDPWNDEDESVVDNPAPDAADVPAKEPSELDSFLSKYEAAAGDDSSIKEAEESASNSKMWTGILQGLSTAVGGREKTDSGFYNGLRQSADARVDAARGDKKSKLADLWQQYQAQRQGKQDARETEKWGLEKPKLVQENQERTDFTTPGSVTSKAATVTALSRVDQAIAEATKVGADTSSLKEFRSKLTAGEFSAKDIKEAGAMGDYKDLLNNQAAMARVLEQGRQSREAADRANQAEERRQTEAERRLARNLRKDIESNPGAKSAIDLDVKVRNMETVAAQNSAQGDEALLMQWEKIMDPNSVVMPSEFERSLQNQGIPSLLARYKGKLDGSQRMRPEDRQKFISAAKALRQQSQGNAQNAMRPYLVEADLAGMDRSRILNAYYDEMVPPAAAPAPGVVQQPAGPKDSAPSAYPRKMSKTVEGGKTARVTVQNEQEAAAAAAKGFQ